MNYHFQIFILNTIKQNIMIKNEEYKKEKNNNSKDAIYTNYN